jgi:hypothetical protein
MYQIKYLRLELEQDIFLVVWLDFFISWQIRTSLKIKLGWHYYLGTKLLWLSCSAQQFLLTKL